MVARGNKQSTIWKEGLGWLGGSSSSDCFGLTTERCRSVELPIQTNSARNGYDSVVTPSLIRSGHTVRARLRRLT